MRRVVIVALLSCAVMFVGQWAGAEDTTASVEAVQAEVARLRQRIAELEKLKDQLAKLEAQLKDLQKQQKATEGVARRFEPITIGGYIQMRWERDSSLAKDSPDLRARARESFRLRRARFDIRSTPLKGLLYRLHFDASDPIKLMDAYLELKAGEGHFTLGIFKVPLLEEVIESSAVRLTPERARVSTALFPDNRDRGITYTWQKPGLPQVTLGLFAGARLGQPADLTSRKSWLIRLVQPLERKGKLGQIWLGRMDGVGRHDFGTAASPNILNFDRDRTIFGLLLTPVNGLTFRGEWVDGKDAGTAASPTAKVRGWYVLLGYKLPELPFTLYAKHDQYDPNRDVVGNTFRRNALGIQYDLNKATRLNLTWEKQKNPIATLWTFQTQLRY